MQDKGKIEEILKLAAAQEQKIKINRVPRPKLDKIHQNNQGIVAEVSGYPYADVLEILERASGELPFILMLDSLQDPQNFGTLIRTAEALGVHGVVIPSARAVDVTPAVVNASSGACEHMLIAQANLSQTIDALKDNDIWVVGLDQAGAEIEAGSRHLKGALGLVVGSEGEGLHDLVRKKCDIVLKLAYEGQNRIPQCRRRGVGGVVSGLSIKKIMSLRGRCSFARSNLLIKRKVASSGRARALLATT